MLIVVNGVVEQVERKQIYQIMQRWKLTTLKIGHTGEVTSYIIYNHYVNLVIEVKVTIQYLGIM